MFGSLSKTSYYFGITGGTQEASNIFTSVEVNLDRPGFLATDKIENGERPDQLSFRIYNTPNYYHTVLSLNGIRNPLVDWNRSLTINEVANKYDGLAFQFGNVNPFVNPLAGITFFGVTAADEYTSIDFSDIQVGDTIIYETGQGSYRVKTFGAGGITGTVPFEGTGVTFSVKITPNYGQCFISDGVDDSRVIDVFAADAYNALLTDEGRVWIINGGYRMDRGAYGSGSSAKIYPDLLSSQIAGISGYGYGVLLENGLTGPIWLGIGNLKGMITPIKNGTNAIRPYGGSGLYTTITGSVTNLLGGSVNQTLKIKKLSALKRQSQNVIFRGVGLTLDGELFNVGITGATYLPQFASGTTFTDVDCGQDFCIGLRSTGGLTAWSGGGEPASIRGNIPAGTDYTAIAAGYFHALALKNDGSVTGWGDNSYGQCVAPSGVSFSKISAGRYFSVGITDTGELKTWGRISIYDGYSGITAFGVTLNNTTYPGTYSKISAGQDHIIALSSGTPKRFVGVITEIDNELKRIVCKDYYNFNEEQFYNTALGTRVSIWRGTQQIKTINNKLIGLQKVINSPIRIEQNGIRQTVTSSSWKSTYLQNYSAPQNSEVLITPYKLIEEYILDQRLDIYALSPDKISNLDRQIKEKILAGDKQIQINISEL